MNERERLIKLLDECRGIEGVGMELLEKKADYLLANGAILPPCKVGDTLFALSTCHDIVAFPEDGVICPYENVCRIEDCMNFNDVLRPFPMTVEIINIGDHGIYSIFFEESKTEYLSTDFGRDVFYTREEAEKALAERGGDGKN